MSSKIRLLIIFLVILIISIILGRRKQNTSDKSIIDSLNSKEIKEESIIDSFYIVRDIYKNKRDSEIQVLDTMSVESGLIFFNEFYEKNKNSFSN